MNRHQPHPVTGDCMFCGKGGTAIPGPCVEAFTDPCSCCGRPLWSDTGSGPNDGECYEIGGADCQLHGQLRDLRAKLSASEAATQTAMRAHAFESDRAMALAKDLAQSRENEATEARRVDELLQDRTMARNETLAALEKLAAAEAEVADGDKRIDRLETENCELRAEVARLRQEVEAAGIANARLIELAEEYEAQWGDDYLAQKWGLKDVLAEIKGEVEELPPSPDDSHDGSGKGEESA